MGPSRRYQKSEQNRPSFCLDFLGGSGSPLGDLGEPFGAPGGHLGGQNGAKDDQTGTQMDYFDIYGRMLGQNDIKNDQNELPCVRVRVEVSQSFGLLALF